MGSQVLVRTNLGGANFTPGINFAVGAQPVRVLAARLNADVRADFVTLNLGPQTATVRLAVAGDPVPPPERGPRQAELRALCLARLRSEGLLEGGGQGIASA